MNELLPAFPDAKDPEACAEYYLVHADEIKAVRSWLASSTRTLSDALKGGRIIRTPVGDYGEIPDGAGWSYSVEIADRYPEYGFAEHKVSFVVDSIEDVRTIDSLIHETVTKALSNRVRKNWKVVTELDKTAIGKFIAESADAGVVADIKSMRKRPLVKGRV